jgi:hypothetical protein
MMSIWQILIEISPVLAMAAAIVLVPLLRRDPIDRW